MFEYEYVIIGNSAAGVGALEGIRKNDRTSSAAIISSETHHTYSRPLISYLLLGKTDRERMKYRADSFYEDNYADFFPGETAVSVDPDAHTVTAESGKVFSYKKLICATGSSPFVPPFAGLDTVDRKFTFMSLDDADSLAASIGESTRVLIVGAGLIGLKCAEGIAARVKSVTVVDLAPRVLSSILTEDAAETVRAHIESAADVKFHLGTSVKEFRGDTAVLDDGEEIGFDVLVLAVGVRANTSLLAAAGAKTERGISVDRGMRTTLPDIYAAGDAVQGYDSSVGTERVLALLPSAYAEGECAGVNASGGDMTLDCEIPMNSIGFFGLHMMTAGAYDGEKTVVALEGLEAAVKEQLELVQKGMYEKAKQNLDSHIFEAHSLEEAKQLQAEHGGFIKTMWCGELECELKMKEEGGMSSRCMPLKQEHLGDTCPICGKPAKKMIYWGIAY